VGLLVLYYAYQAILNNWFVKGGIVNYDTFFKNFIQVVSKENYFMNYGLWNPEIETLQKANKALVQFMLEKSGLQEGSNQRILDVGCGYGEQDFEWLKAMDKTNHITAIDISESQIRIASEKCKRSALEKRLVFEHGDAHMIDKKFASAEFDSVMSVESAFHYHDRPQFFSGVSEVLKPGGTFVISDIVLNDEYEPTFLNGCFIRLYSDFLNIPSANLIKTAAWKKSLEDAELTINECLDLTDKTFIPYYERTFKAYMENGGYIPKWIVRIGLEVFKSVQPFAYKIAICKKVAA
jgi:cyclopropane fatty-acyl-phospholipid synthase-like methyltransferase